MAVFSPHDSFAAFSWFTEFQNSFAVKAGIVPEWFHGVISRKAAEKRLMSRPPGCFLIRVGESRVGYTLSYRGDDRSRHFMIDMLPGNQCVIVGEGKLHNSLHELVAFHRITPFSPFRYLLTVACEQADKTNHAELFSSQRKDMNLNNMNCLTQVQVAPNISEHSPTSPALPTSPTAGLYPCLNTELSTLYPQSLEQPAKPVPNLRTINNNFTTSTQEAPPLAPPRLYSPGHPHAVVGVNGSPGPMMVYPEKQSVLNTPAEAVDPNQQKQPKATLISLVQMKRKLRNKHGQSEDHKDFSKEPALENVTFNPPQSMQNVSLMLHENCSTASYRTSDGVPNSTYKPIEYLTPPPFAPGY